MPYEPEAEMVENYKSRAAQIGWPALADIAEHAGDSVTAAWMREQKPTPAVETTEGGVIPAPEDDVDDNTQAAAEKRAAEAGSAPEDDTGTPKGRRAPAKATAAGKG